MVIQRWRMVVQRVLGNSGMVQFIVELWMTRDEMEQSSARRRSIVETISFAILFLVAIVEGDCQLIYGMEGGGLSLFSVCYQVLEAIWQSLVEVMAQNCIIPVQLCCVLHEFHIISDNFISWLYMEVVDEIGGIFYWVQESEMHLELFHKEMPSKELGLCIAKVFLLQCNFEPILCYTGEVGYREIDFLFIGGKLQGVGIEKESVLEQEVIKLVGVRTVKGVQNTGL